MHDVYIQVHLEVYDMELNNQPIKRQKGHLLFLNNKV